MKKLLSGILLAISLASAASAQTLSNLPPNTVVGRLGAGVAGPAQAIPFTTLLAQLNGTIGVVGGPATSVIGDMAVWSNTAGNGIKDSGIAVTGSGTIAMGSNNTLTLSASPTFSGSGTLNVASGKTLTDTSGAGAVLLLGATGGGFAGYAGTSACTNQAITSISTAGVGSCLANRAGTNSTVASPTAPNSNSAFTMQGLGGTITPAVSGKILITISGTITDPGGATAAGHGVKYQLSYGTGSAPTANAALTGTQVGTIQVFELDTTVTTAADLNRPFSLSVVVTGLTVGTAYWVDLAAEQLSAASEFGFSAVNIAASEI